jgi:hypothetical protein
MKQFIANALTALLTGIFFCLGIMLIGFIAVHFNADERSKPDLTYTHFPKDVRITHFYQVPGMPELTIRGSVENTGTTIWKQVVIEASIRVGGTLMNRCETDVFGSFPSHATREFQIKCFNVAGSNLPNNTSYELVVSSAGSEG